LFNLIFSSDKTRFNNKYFNFFVRELYLEVGQDFIKKSQYFLLYLKYIMKYLYKVLFFLFIPIFGYSQTFVSTSTENKNVLLEQFTGMYATYDPAGHAISDQIKANNPNDVFLVRIHSGAYSNPNGPTDPNFQSSYGDYILNNSGLAGFPAGTINRRNFEYIGISPQGQSGTTALGRGDWQQAATEVLSETSPVNIGAQAFFDVSTGILTVNTETYYTSTVTATQKLNIAVLENNLAGPQNGAASFNPADIISGPWSPTYNHRDVLRHLMEGQNGLQLSTTSSGTFIANTHTWNVPLNFGQAPSGYYPDIDPTNLEVIAFISEGDQDIYTAFETQVVVIFTNNYDVNLISVVADDVVCSSENDIKIVFRNYGNITLNSCDFNYSINGTSYVYNWTGNLSPGIADTIILSNVLFTPQSSNSVTCTALNPNGQTDQNLTNNSVSNNFTHQDQSGNVISGIQPGIINVEITTDGYGSETSWEIVDEAGNVFGQGGQNGSYQSNQTYLVQVSVPASKCFEFILYDSYGDGMCCSYGSGSVILSDSYNSVFFNLFNSELTNFTDLSVYFATGTPVYGCIDSDTLESFESGQGITWELDPNNTVDWTNISGGTSSLGTGPSGAFDGSYYMYTEASGNSNKEAIMYVSCVDPLAWNQLSFVFAYHMSGTNMGSLTIDVSTDSGATWTQEWTISGNQGNIWNEVQLDLGAYTQNISVRVHAQTGNGYRSDIAIDLLRFEEYPVSGCIDPFASNFDSLATIDDGSCLYNGCTDILAANFDPLASVDDSSCVYCNLTTTISKSLPSSQSACDGLILATSISSVSISTYSCTNSLGTVISTNNFASNLCSDDYVYTIIDSLGCTTIDTILLWDIYGCTDSTALNYNSFATADDGSCLYCDLTTIINQSAPSSNSSCDGFILTTSISSVSISTYSCTNSLGTVISTNNFASNLCSDGYIFLVSDSLGCTTIDTILLGDIYGCTDSLAFNYLWAANLDDGSCMPTILGCIDTLALNYDSLANTDDGSCCVIDNLLEQVGSTLYGGWYANSGRAVSLSNDGNTLAVGDPNFTPLGGKVKLFTKISDPSSGLSSWTQVGSSINGDNPYDQFGSSISISANGNIVAIGAPSNDNNGSSSGLVKVYEKINGLWSQIGQTLQGSNGDQFGQSLSLSSDGSIIVIGAPYNDDNGYNFGQMKVFENISGYWNLSGVFNGNGWNGRMGSSVSINANGNIVASIYEYEVKVLINNSGTWNQMGNDILSSYSYGNYDFTSSISLDNSGTTIVVGNPGGGVGFVDIFKFNSISWNIDGVIPNFSSGSNTGQSVSLSNDGNTVVIGAPNSSNFGNHAGEVRLYTRISTPNIGTYTWTQKGQSLSSNRNDSYSGYSVSIAENGKSVAFGSPEYYYGNPGSAQVFRFENNCAGCTDSFALNYDSTMQYDDGSCIYPSGCTDPTAYNYDSIAVNDDGSCLYCDLSNNFLVNNNTSGNCNGFIISNSSSSNSPISYLWSTGSTQNNIIGLCAGVYSVTITDNVGCILQDTIYMNIIVGCTDSTALNYDPLATIDDGSCTYSSNCTSPKPNGLYAYDVIDTRAKIGWNNMNDSACMVLKYFVRYREVGTNSWITKSAGVGNGLCIFGLNTVTKQLLNLSPSTLYEFKMKAFYCGGTSSNYSPAVQFTTSDVCPDMINLSVQTFNGNKTKARFTWDTTGVYTFARVLLRVDTTGANWLTAGGFGVNFPTFFVNKFGLTPGESYRAQGRTFCDPNITAYRSPTWTSPIFWSQPDPIRLDGGVSINNLDVYPNPSRDLFNISFSSDKVQDLSIRILSVVGAEVYREDKQQFVGEYTKQISLDNYGKGIYFLEIQTPNGIVNKKLILQ